MNITSSTQKANVTNLIRKYIEAKHAEAEAKAAKTAAANELIELMDGEKSEIWKANDGSAYQLTVIYGKTSRSLSKDLVESVLGVTVTDACFKTSNPWNELRITMK